MNEVYARHVGDAPPARATIEVAALPSGAKVEIEAIAGRLSLRPGLRDGPPGLLPEASVQRVEALACLCT